MTIEHKPLEDADLAAQYFRALVQKGIPVHHAVTLTGNWILPAISAENQNRPPQEPWDQ